MLVASWPSERSFFQQVLDVFEGFVADVDAVIEIAARPADSAVTLEPLRIVD